MELYKELYFKLFAAMADAAEALERGEALRAHEALLAAMRRAEDAVVETEG